MQVKIEWYCSRKKIRIESSHQFIVEKVNILTKHMILKDIYVRVRSTGKLLKAKIFQK